VDETDTRYHVKLQSSDGETHLEVKAKVTDMLPATSVFQSIEEASAFFETGSLGYSPAAQADCYEGLELETFEWKIEPLEVQYIVSSFFQESQVFPPSSVVFDCALLMRRIPHRWHTRPLLKLASPSTESVG